MGIYRQRLAGSYCRFSPVTDLGKDESYCFQCAPPADVLLVPNPCFVHLVIWWSVNYRRGLESSWTTLLLLIIQKRKLPLRVKIISVLEFPKLV